MQSNTTIIISCAGIGSRLGFGKTKALLNIADQSIILRNLKLFDKYDDVRVVIGYQFKQVINEVLKYRKDVLFVFNHDYFNTQTGASIYLGSKNSKQFILGWDGDLLVHPKDIDKILKNEEEFLGYSKSTSESGIYVALDEDNYVTKFTREKLEFEWTGPFRINTNRVKETKGSVFEMIEKDLPIKGIEIEAYDIDTYDDYERVNKIVKKW
jgi:choline kinase